MCVQNRTPYLSWYIETKETLFAISASESYNNTPQHNMLNLVTRHEQMKLETRLWILISAACHLRILQISGYFGAAKLKVFYDRKTFQKVVNIH